MPFNISDEATRASVQLLQGDKRINVTVVEAEPVVSNVVGDAFVDVGEGVHKGNAASGVVVDEHASDPTHYIGVVQSFKKQGFSQRLQRAVFLALKRAGRNGMHSAWVNVSDKRAQEFPVSMSDVLLTIIEGIRMYAQHVREDKSGEHIADIIVAAGEMVLDTQRMEYGDLDQMLHMHLGDMTPPTHAENALASRVENNMPAVPRNPVVTKWLEMIGGEIASMARNPDDGFHRVSPTAPIMPRTSFIVFFDAQTGEPRSVTSRNQQLDPGKLSRGMAAVQVSYVDRLGFIDPSEHLVTSEPLSQRAMDVLQSLMGAKPIVPLQGVRVEGVHDGVQVISTAVDHDEQNTTFAAALLNVGMDELRMTIGFIYEYLSPIGIAALGDWLARRMGKDRDQLDKVLQERFMGYQQYDLYVDAAGRFIGGTTYMDLDHTARGTEYKKGITTGAAGIARQIAVHTYVAEDGSTYKVPVMEGAWEGGEGLAKRSFDSWYHSKEFEHMRVGILAQDAFSKLMFADISAKDRFIIFDHYLRSDDAAMQGIGASHARIGSQYNIRKHGKEFANIMKGMARAVARSGKLSKADEVSVMYLEMLMRNALGDERVDELLRPDTPSSPNGIGSPGGPQRLPSGGGVQGGGQFASAMMMQGSMNAMAGQSASVASMMTMIPVPSPITRM